MTYPTLNSKALYVHTYKLKGMWNKVDQIEKSLILKSEKLGAGSYSI